MSVVGVVGAGLMGAGIAQVAAVADHDVVLVDVDDASIARGIEAIEASLARFVAKGRLEQAQATSAVQRIARSTDLGALADAHLVVEAVFEQLDVKRDIFARLDKVVSQDAILATNTSALPITDIASATAIPQRVVGTHFFSPVPMMQLCELVRGIHTTDNTLQRARDFAESVGKTVIVVERDIAGFVTTRLIAALSAEAIRLFESGVATAADIDTACKLAFGHPMGPFETADLTGLDILLHATDNVYAERPSDTFAAPELLRRMVAAGRLGRKTGHGFYEYE